MSRGNTGPPAAWAALVAALALDVGSAWRATAQPASDVRTYHAWITGPLPGWDAPGPYPLGADALWWPLRWVPAHDVNLLWLLACTLPATLVACAVLARTASRPVVAVTVWLAAAGLLERSYWMRLEPVAALAVLLMVVGVRRGRVAGPALALSCGALIKVWPVFLAPLAVLVLLARGGRGPVRRSWARWLGWFALPWAGYALVLLALRPRAGITWFTFTFSRRTQGEALSVLPTQWAMAAGDRTWRMTYVGGLDSADVVLGPGLHAARLVLQAVGVAVLAVLAARVVRRPAGPDPQPAPDAGADGAADGDGAGGRLVVVLATQVAVLLVIIFAGPAFSPQYLIWFAAPLAVAAGEGLLGREVLTWLAGCALTYVEFPLLWNEMRRADPVAVAALTARDAVLVVLLLLCLGRVRRATSPVPWRSSVSSGWDR